MIASQRHRTETVKNRGFWAGADWAIGALLCGAGAGVAGLFSSGEHWRVCIPLIFSLVLLLIAVVFGARAGILGTVLAAAIFALFFSPVGRLSVINSSARSNIAWMLLIGVAFSFLFAPSTSLFRRQ